ITDLRIDHPLQFGWSYTSRPYRAIPFIVPLHAYPILSIQYPCIKPDLLAVTSPRFVFLCKVTVDEHRSSIAVLPLMKFDGNFPQSQIPAFHKILFPVPCPLFLPPPFEPHVKQTLTVKSEGFKGREIK
ncbi:MAG: hypothetical protein K1V92_02375, partial [Bacteroides acidifaciens]